MAKISDETNVAMPIKNIISIIAARLLVHYNIFNKEYKSATLFAVKDIPQFTSFQYKIENNQIKGAGLDVYLNEPTVPEKLKNLKNVFLLPHLGSATEETREAMGLRVYDNITAFFNDNEPLDRVV